MKRSIAARSTASRSWPGRPRRRAGADAGVCAAVGEGAMRRSWQSAPTSCGPARPMDHAQPHEAEAAGTLDIASSLSAVIVSDGLVPRLEGMTEPSQIIRLS